MCYSVSEEGERARPRLRPAPGGHGRAGRVLHHASQLLRRHPRIRPRLLHRLIQELRGLQDAAREARGPHWQQLVSVASLVHPQWIGPM